MNIHSFIKAHLIDDSFFMDIYYRHQNDEEQLNCLFEEWCYNFPDHIDLNDTLDSANSYYRSARIIARLWYKDSDLVSFIDKCWKEYIKMYDRKNNPENRYDDDYFDDWS